MIQVINLEPEIISIKFADQRADLVHYRLGQGERRLLIMAGVHGREHGGVQAAYELLEQLAARPLRGQVDILPVCNPMAYAAESRFTPGSERNMSLTFTTDPPRDLTEALSQAVLALAKGTEMVLNLHSAGPARYLPHVMFYRPEDAEWAASLGLPFAIMPCGLDAMPNHIAARLQPDQRTVTLELGGGIVAYPEDIAMGVEAILALLGRSGFLEPGDYEREPTPPELIYMYDARLFVRAPAEGAFYTQARLGADFSQGEPFGFWVPLDGLQPQPVVAPEAGKLIYLRTRNRVSQGETLAMFLPHQNNGEE
ncbi:MAG: succinylglutamate desuccinylase/aspartoacylase family protein [Anaerolineae bacterium]|nr:succinylglutamate desuccinylase/aspartoacylase family protein [Anaerolineae bacterium]